MIATCRMAGASSACADRGDAAVHHVRRGDDVGAGRRLDQRLLGQDGDRLVVEDIAIVVGQAVMAVAGVGIERDVGQHADLGHRILDRLDRAADEVVGVERLAGIVAAQVRRRVGEQGDAGDAGARLRGPGRRAGRRSSG